jgi:hypothetical protein
MGMGFVNTVWFVIISLEQRVILYRFGAHTGTMPITLYGTEEQTKIRA